MVAESNDPHPAKRRTRIKVNHPIVTETSSTITIDIKQTGVQDVIEPNELNNDVLSDEGDARTYEIEKNEKEHSILEEEDTDDDAVVEDVFAPNSKSTPVQEPPKPAPRTRKFVPVPTQRSPVETTSKDDGSSSDTPNEPIPPLPRSRSIKPIKDDTNAVNEKGKNEVKAVKKESKKRKILKAADVISSVLRKDNKNSQRIVLPEGGDDDNKEKEEGEEDAGLGSPWDSPPPPQALDKVYIQHKHGFSVHDWAELFKKPDSKIEVSRNRNLTDIALQFHNLWTRLMFFSHGVIAGIACCHILSVAAALAATQHDVEQFVQFYHFLSLKVHFAVYVFTTLCIISCFDRLDIGELSKNHLREVGRSHGALLTMVAYICCLILSLAAHRHTAAIDAYKSNKELWDSQGLQEWYWLVTCRDVVLLATWVFIAFSSPTDLLAEKLTAMGEQDIGMNSGFKMTSPTNKF